MAIELVTPAAARAAIAAHLLPDAADARLGEIVLATHQVAAARRLLALLATHGGGLFADDVGLGKTFVALAVARRYAHVTVMAPAALRSMWLAASARAGVAITLTSYEALSRGAPGSAVERHTHAHGRGQEQEHEQEQEQEHEHEPGRTGAIVILDEAHHARTTGTRRYPRIAALAGRAHVLLLTATPVHNRLGDLRALVALFAGARAWDMSADELAAVIFRRRAGTVRIPLPAVARPRWIEIGDDAACLDALLRLPPPVPPADGGDGGVLLTLGLVRQWASSRAALVAALRRALAKSLALGDAVAAGRMPTVAQLRSWQFADDSLQLAFPELVAAPAGWAIDPALLARSLREHVTAVSQLLATLGSTPDPDAERARHVAALQHAHAGERIVCFTEYTETVAAYWHYLRSAPGVARLSAQGGEIASGRVSRDAVLQRFAPAGQRVRPPPAIESVTMLITTDLLSEGVDLRDATVVVHLDLPWSPARLEQRVGRARRMGSRARAISVYAMHPAAAGEAVLDLERRLHGKMAIVARTVGSSASILPGHIGMPDGHALDGAPETSVGGADRYSDAEKRSLLVDRVATWSQRGDMALPSCGGAVAAFVRASAAGWLAAVSVGGERLLLASVCGRRGSEPSLIAAACDLADRGTDDDAPLPEPQPALGALLGAAVAEATRHAAEAAAAGTLSPAGTRPSSDAQGRPRATRAGALARIRRALLAAAPHDAPRVAALAAAARRVVCGRMSAGLEHRLEHLTALDIDDSAWLAAVGTLAPEAAPAPPGYELRAIIVFVATGPSRGSTTPS